MKSGNAIYGCLIGTAVGDALGLPCEALSPDKQRKYFGEISGHRLFFGRGMYSDDTEHTFMVAQALISSRGEVEAFRQSLARQLRSWILMLPVGVGLATLRACWKLVFGVKPQQSGVYSAGNGPAMRAAISGVFAQQMNLTNAHLIELNRASTQITHTDPRAEYGALAIALAARFALSQEVIDAEEFLQFFTANFPFQDAAAKELLTLVASCVEAVTNGLSTSEFCMAQSWTGGASGYIYHTVPAALHAWLSHPNDYQVGVLEMIHCGGDTDSTAAIVGGLIGARTKEIPIEWIENLREWPRDILWMHRLAERLDEVISKGRAQTSLPTLWPGVLLRNFFFLSIIFLHGLRRILPF